MDKGGVMSYDAVTQKEFKFTGGNPAEVCNHVNRQVRKQHACMHAWSAG